MKALRSAHHTDPDVEEEEEGGFGGGGGGGGRMRSGCRARRARCPVSSPELRAKQKMPPKSILLIRLLFIYFNPPLPTEIRLIPPEEGLAHRFCVSGSASRGEDRESGAVGGALRLAQGHVSSVELGRRFVVSPTLPNLLRR